jgi:hypothetical protein
MLEINLITLRTGATRRKQVVDVDIPRSRAMGRACAPANWCSRPG